MGAQRLICFLLFVLPQVAVSAQGVQFDGAETDSIPWSIDLDDVVVTAQYAPSAIERATNRVVTIQEEEIKTFGYNTLSEALAQQLNLQIGADPILGNGVSIQGISGQNVQVLIDGVPMVGRLGGNIDLSQVSLENVARIEIIPGSMSARYGSNAAGGVINLISKQTQPNAWRVDLSGQQESVGIERRSAIVGRQIGKFQVDVGYRDFNTDLGEGNVDTLRALEEVQIPGVDTFNRKVVPWNPKQQDGWHANVQFQLGKEGLIRYGYEQFDEELILYGPLSGRVRPAAFDETFNTQRRSHSLHYKDWIDWGNLGKLYLESTAGWNEFDRTSVLERIFPLQDSIFEIPGGRDTTQYGAFLHRTILSSRTNRAWDFQLGVEYLSENGNGGRIRDTSAIDEEAPVLSSISAWVGGRYEFADTGLRLEGTLRTGYNSQYDYPLIPAINLLYNLQDRWQLRLGYSHGFRAPSLRDLYFWFVDLAHDIVGDPNLRPEFSRHVEASIDGELLRKNAWNLNVNARGFFNRIRNRISLVQRIELDDEGNPIPQNPLQPPSFVYANFDEFQTHGFNLGFRLSDPNNRLSLDGGFGLTFRKFSQLTEDQDLDSEFATLVEFQNELRYRIPLVEVDFSIQHRHIGRQEQLYFDDSGDIQIGFIDNFDLVNTSLSKRFFKGRILVNVGAKNLFDVQRVQTTGQNGGAHSGGSGSRLIDFGRNYFVRLGFSL
ncbi:MAG: TonB-dependent receptor [Bacteroidota bacterium]